MKVNFLPNRKEVFRKKRILLEKRSDKDLDLMWEGYYVLDFNPYSNKNKTELLVSSANNSFPIDLVNWNKDYCSFDIKILDNIGESDGSDFIEWINCFYDKKNSYYRFNIYDLDAKDIDLYVINKDLEKLIKFNLSTTVIKNPIFFNSKRNNYYDPQFALTLCTKQSVIFNKIQF